MDKYRRFNAAFLREFDDSVERGKKNELYLTLFQLKIPDEDRILLRLYPKGKKVNNNWLKTNSIGAANKYFILKQKLALVLLVNEIVLKNKSAKHVDFASIHLTDLVNKFKNNFKSFPLNTIDPQKVAKLAKKPKNKNSAELLLNLANCLGVTVDVPPRKLELTFDEVLERLGYEEEVDNLDAYVDKAFLNLNNESMLFLHTVYESYGVGSHAEDLIKRLDDRENGVFFMEMLVNCQKKKFSKVWAKYLNTFLDHKDTNTCRMMQTVFLYKEFADEFCKTPTFPKLINILLNEEKQVAFGQHVDYCWMNIYNYMGGERFMKEVWMKNLKHEKRFLNIFANSDENFYYEKMEPVIKRVIELVKKRKYLSTLVGVLIYFTASYTVNEKHPDLAIDLVDIGPQFTYVLEQIFLYSEKDQMKETIKKISKNENLYKMKPSTISTLVNKHGTENLDMELMRKHDHHLVSFNQYNDFAVSANLF